MIKNRDKKKSKDEKEKSEASFLRFTIFLIIKLIIFIVALLGFSMAGILGGAFYAYFNTTKMLVPEDLIINRNLTTSIYDSEDNLLDELTGKENINREEILYHELPQHMIDAVVAIEDERFFQHQGIDIKRIGASVYELFKNSGDVVQGGSTITQQLVKNVSGKTKTSFERKVQEWFTAIDLEYKMNKEQILEKYLNIVNEGNGYYGVGTASKKYFGKNISDITIAEAAILAGIPNAPTYYNPRSENGYKNMKERQETILFMMNDLGYITVDEYRDALSEKIVIMEPEENIESLKPQSYFVDEVIKRVAEGLAEKYDISYNLAVSNIYSNGYKIYTTMVPAVQKSIDEVYTDESYIYSHNIRAKMYGETPQSGIVVINPKTGHVAGMYGGLGEKTASMVQNRATDLKRQSGSSMKPISVYGPAIDMKLITPGTIIDDVPIYMLGKESTEGRYPENFDHVYNGLTSIRNGLKASINVVATRVLVDYLGFENSREYLEKSGITILEEEMNVSGLALGGLVHGVSPLQMAAAYVPFANKGLYYEPVFFTKVYDKDGREILTTVPEYRTVYDEKSAYLMVDMMKEVLKGPTSIHGISPRRNYPINGTAYTNVEIFGKDGVLMPTAGKTGTTSDNRDKWFVGYTPYYTAAVWYGYDNNINPIEIETIREIDGETFNERNSALKLWNAVMNKIHENLEIIDFDEPRGLVRVEICIYSGQIPTDLCRNDPRGDATIEELFIKGTEPRGNDLCEVHVEATLCTEQIERFKVYNSTYGPENDTYVDKALLANEYCPEETKVTKIMIQRPAGKEIQLVWPPMEEDSDEFKKFELKYYYENRKHFRSDAYPLDWTYEVPFGEYCTIHGIPEEEQIIDEAQNAGEDAATETTVIE